MENFKLYRMIVSICMLSAYMFAHQQHLDVMGDFSYPVNDIEMMRHHVAQGLHFMEASMDNDDNCRRAIDQLEQADNTVIDQERLSSDDRETLQNLLQQLNGLIDRLENNQYRSDLSSVCLNLQNKF